MTKLKKISIITIISSILLTFNFTLNIKAANGFETSETFEPIIISEQSIGRSAQSTEELFSSTQIFNAIQPILSNIKIAYANGNLNFSSTLTYEGETTFINTYGQMYKNEKTANSGNSGNLILADMEDVEEWHFVQFRIDKDNNQILIIMQSTSSEEFLQFVIDINTTQYNDLYDCCKNPIEGKELEEKIVRLYSVSKNLINEENSETDYVEFEVSSSDLNKQRTTTNSTYAGYKDMIDKLRKSLKVKTSSLSNIDIGMFTGNGWQRDKNFGTGEASGNELRYDFITYSVPNGQDRYLAQISLSYTITKQEKIANGKVKESFDYRYVDGMVVEYDSLMKEITVLYYDMGIRFRNLEIAIGTKSPNAYFVNQIINGKCSGTGNSFLQAFGGWIDPTGGVVDLFIALNDYKSREINDIKSYPSTIEEQKEYNGGKLIQVIAVSSGQRMLEFADHHLYIEGDIVFSNILEAYYNYKGEMGKTI